MIQKSRCRSNNGTDFDILARSTYGILSITGMLSDGLWDALGCFRLITEKMMHRQAKATNTLCVDR